MDRILRKHLLLVPVAILCILFLQIQTVSAQIPTVTLDQLEDHQKDNHLPGLDMGFQWDFVSASAFSFSTTSWFRRRGYDSEYSDVYITGIPMNDLETGRAQWSLWGGLNRVMRRYSSNGLYPVAFGHTSIGGGTMLDPRASNIRNGLRFSYANSNRSYRHRAMFTYSSGTKKSGWAYVFSGSVRYSDEGYTPGTFYNAWSYFGAVEKAWSWKDRLALSVWGVNTHRGKQGPTYQEMTEIAGTNYYNPYWGYQAGEKRNGYVAHHHMPTAVLTYEHKFSKQSTWRTAASYQFGQNGATALDWLNARDPRPDYYRKLPSFADDSLSAALIYDVLSGSEQERQIDWDYMYNINRSDNSITTIENANGGDETVTGKLARYIIEDRRYDSKRFAIANTFSEAYSDNFTLYAGANYVWQKKENFKEVHDLLGADFFLDINEFAERDFPDDPDKGQNDLNNINQILDEGDRFGYDYDAVISKATVFGIGLYSFPKVDFFFGLDARYTSFYRDGKMRNGQFADNSFGKSETQTFFDPGIKAGITYKATGRHVLFANTVYETRAPFFRNAYISPRTRDQIAPNLVSEKIHGLEAGYVFRSPYAKVNVVGYYTTFKDQTRTMSFYHDEQRTFVNYTLTGIDKRHMGVEIGSRIQVVPSFSVSANASIGEYIYTNRPTATVTQDNNSEALQTETVYAKNFHVGGTPEMAYTIGLHYNSPKYWFVNVNFNYTDRLWIQHNPARRTLSATEGVDPESPEWNEIIEQEQVDGAFTMNLFGGYSWKIDNTFKDMKKSMYLAVFLGINNITNNRDAISNGYEQLRFDFLGKDVDRFPSKYYYGLGTNYFLNVVWRY